MTASSEVNTRIICAGIVSTDTVYITPTASDKMKPIP